MAERRAKGRGGRQVRHDAAREPSQGMKYLMMEMHMDHVRKMLPHLHEKTIQILCDLTDYNPYRALENHIFAQDLNSKVMEALRATRLTAFKSRDHLNYEPSASNSHTQFATETITSSPNNQGMESNGEVGDKCTLTSQSENLKIQTERGFTVIQNTSILQNDHNYHVSVNKAVSSPVVSIGMEKANENTSTSVDSEKLKQNSHGQKVLVMLDTQKSNQTGYKLKLGGQFVPLKNLAKMPLYIKMQPKD